MKRWWRDLDWNWRDFGWQEWAFLGAAVLAPLVFLVLAAFLNEPFNRLNAAFWAVYTLLMSFNGFVAQNRRRRGVLGTRFYEPHPGRPISIGALQAILAGGFVLLALLLVGVVSLGSR